MVKQINLREYLENNLKIKCREVDTATEQFIGAQSAFLRGKLELANLCLDAAMVAASNKDRTIEDFTFSTNILKEQIEKNIIDFYKAQDYEFIGETPRRGYVFQRENSMRIVTFTHTSLWSFITVLKE